MKDEFGDEIPDWLLKIDAIATLRSMIELISSNSLVVKAFIDRGKLSTAPTDYENPYLQEYMQDFQHVFAIVTKETNHNNVKKEIKTLICSKVIKNKDVVAIISHSLDFAKDRQE